MNSSCMAAHHVDPVGTPLATHADILSGVHMLAMSVPIALMLPPPYEPAHMLRLVFTALLSPGALRAFAATCSLNRGGAWRLLSVIRSPRNLRRTDISWMTSEFDRP